MKGTKTLFRNPYMYYYDRYKGNINVGNPDGDRHEDKIFLDYWKKQGREFPKDKYYKEDAQSFNDWFWGRINYVIEEDEEAEEEAKSCERCGGWTQGDSCHCHCLRITKKKKERIKYLLKYLTNKAHCGSLGADGRINISEREDHYLEEFKTIKGKIEELEVELWPNG